MTAGILFTIAIFLLLLRIFYLRVRANSAKSASFKRLAPKDKMAVLKECLLNNPSEGSLQNLKEFCDSVNVPFDAEGYRPFIAEQLALADRQANYVECDKLYVKACEFVDRTAPMEFADAEGVRAQGNLEKAIEYTLEGISRLYSDKAIIEALTALEPEYPKAKTLREKYIALAEACDSSGADEKSLEALRKLRDAWMADLLTFEK